MENIEEQARTSKNNVLFSSELPPEEIEKIKELREQGLSYHRIAKILNRSVSVVYKYAQGIAPTSEKDVIDFMMEQNKKLELRIIEQEHKITMIKETLEKLINLFFEYQVFVALKLGWNINDQKLEELKEEMLKSLGF
jgi:predicted transcriptional regulator